MEEILKRYFGYDEFRPMQRQVIEKVLGGKDVVAIMPTGGGKSLCYQIPALKLDGLTIVVSPLISLMKDQVDGLKANGIPAEYINSTLDSREALRIELGIMNGEIKLLYIAPERIESESFMRLIRIAEVSLIAVDEAHCISEWGHDFRPSYRKLKSLREFFPETPMISLTATATEKVRGDIIKELSLKEPEMFISSFDRKNLNLSVTKKKKSFDKIMELLKGRENDSVIIYCHSRKEVENLSRKLNENGLNSLPYHAGLDNKIRKHNQELFIKDKVEIIVATIAFGMGIDKPDVRLIIHHTFPKTLEGYYQEIGRAGRDGLPSDCIMFYSYGDKRKHEFFIDQLEDEDSKAKEKEKLNKVIRYCETRLCRRRHILRHFGEEYKEEKCNKCDVCLGTHEDFGKEAVSSGKGNKDLTSWENESGLDYDKKLFIKLKILRRKIADERKVPPYIIFSDVSLQEMAFCLPKNSEEFLEIKGVGQQKLEDFGGLFLKEIRNYLGEIKASNS
ncbi:MAG: RecQ family ATP-dependent DNA helicase [Candidatus Pacearchaeota archaeon]